MNIIFKLLKNIIIISKCRIVFMLTHVQQRILYSEYVQIEIKIQLLLLSSNIDYYYNHFFTLNDKLYILV